MEQELTDNKKTYKLIILAMIAVFGLVHGVVGANYFPEGTSQLIPNAIGSVFLTIIALYWLIKDSEKENNPITTGFIVLAAIFTTISLLYYAFDMRGPKNGFFLFLKYLGYFVLYILFLIVGEFFIYDI